MFKFTTPDRVYMGDNIIATTENLFSRYGSRALIVTGPHIGKSTMTATLERTLDNDRVKYTVMATISGEPTVSMIEAGVELYREKRCDFVIGLGGGSPLDAAKAIAAMTVLPGSIADYKGTKIKGVELPPVICIPTTAGTGSEVTKYTIITDEQTGEKMLLKGDALLPKVAMVDFTFSNSCSKPVTAATGLDALTHAIEAFISVDAQPLSDALALSALKRIMRFLPVAYRDGSHKRARREMAVAALEAGMCINNASVTLVHGMSRPLGAKFHIPHGMANAMLLRTCLNDMEQAARHNLARIASHLHIHHVDEIDASEKFVEEVMDLLNKCEVPTLKEYGIDAEEYEAAIETMCYEAIKSGSPSNAPKEYTAADIERLYRQAYKE